MDKQMERLYQAAKALKNINSQAGIARALNASSQTVKNWESRGISKQGLLDAQKYFGVSAQWLESGEGDMEVPKGDFVEGPKMITWSKNDPLPDDEFIHVPFYKDIKLAGGNGSLELEDNNNFTLPFGRATLHKMGVHSSNCFTCTSTNNSMAPVIPEGATIAVDKGQTKIKDGKIYAIMHGGMGRFKVMYELPNSEFRLKSYNSEEYPDEVVSSDEIEIIGRVFWWSMLDYM